MDVAQGWSTCLWIPSPEPGRETEKGRHTGHNGVAKSIQMLAAAGIGWLDQSLQMMPRAKSEQAESFWTTAGW